MRQAQVEVEGWGKDIGGKKERRNLTRKSVSHLNNLPGCWSETGDLQFTNEGMEKQRQKWSNLLTQQTSIINNQGFVGHKLGA